jgi:hypothetical protein
LHNPDTNRLKYTIFVLAASLTVIPVSVWAQNPVNLPGQVGPTLSAKPFSTAEKFDYRVVQTIGIRGFLGAAVSAGFGQLAGNPQEWGGGVEGYAKRYGSSFGGNLARQSMAFALENALHEDPRYFPSEEKGFVARFKNAALQTLVTRTDAQGERFAFSRIISAYGNGQFMNLWQPSSNNSVGDGLVRGTISLGGDFGYNLLQEFLPFTRPHTLRHH